MEMQCHGTISCLYGSFLNLEKFTLSGSGFTGTVPLELCNLVDVLFLDLGQLSHRRLSLVTFPTSSTISRPSMPAKISSRALFKISFLAGITSGLTFSTTFYVDVIYIIQKIFVRHEHPFLRAFISAWLLEIRTYV